MGKLWEAWSRSAAERGAKTAVVTGEARATYAELDAGARSFAVALEGIGAGEGTPVLSFLPDDAGFLAAFLGANQLGAAFVPIDPSLTADEVRAIRERFDDVHLVTTPELAKRFPEAPPSQLHIDGLELVEDRLTTIAAHPELRGVAQVQCTSGSTGVPKGILVGDEALLFRALDLVDSLGVTDDERTLCAVPLSHSHGTDCLAFPTLLRGGTLFLLPPAAAAPNTVFSLIHQHRLTFFSSVPGFYEIAAKLIPASAYDLSSVRLMFCGSAALAGATAESFWSKFGVAISQGYGLAEIGAICGNRTVAENRKYESIGQLWKGAAHRLTEEGELVLTSPGMAHGYLGQPEVWAEMCRGGELFTGDLAQVDEDGDFWLIGRKTAFVNVGGQKVFPVEIERVLAEVSDVQEAAVTAEPDPVLGQRVVAHVVLFPDRRGEAQALERAIGDHLRARLSAFKLPRRIVFHDDLPKSPLGKILRGRIPADS